MSDNNYKDLWQFAMKQIEEEYKNKKEESVFNLWYNIKYSEDNENRISAEVPSDFMWKMMNDKGYIKNIISHIESLSGQTNIEIIPIVKNSAISTESSDEKETNLSKPEINKSDKNSESNTKQNVIQKNSTLDSKYTFDNFITEEGSSSNFAYKVAMAVANTPGVDKTNPILLYGGCGLGKTHLMQAIGNEILKTSEKPSKILYIQAESFTNDFTNSLATKTPKKFNEKYRNLDVLLLDDIQFLQGKESTQEALFYIFEALKIKKAQMVFTCDRPLKEIENLTDRLQSRIGSGMCLDLQPPTFETRKAIIIKKLENEDKTLSEPVIDLIAKTVQTNIRDLESALKKIIGYLDFIDTEITPEIAANQLSDYMTKEIKGNVSIENIMKVVANDYNISVSDMKCGKRQKKFVIPRHIALYIAYQLTEYTFSDLGYEFGGRDHSSIMHACEKIEKAIKTDPSLKQKIDYLIKEIKEHK